jgi:two-component system, cell cycle sensor histidine kinase and response regulator CckA
MSLPDAAHQEELQRLRRLVDHDLTGDAVIRPDGSVVMCNPAYLRILGFDTPEEAHAANFFSLLHSRSETAELLSLLRVRGTIGRHELQLSRPGGEAIYVVARLVGTFDEAGDLVEAQVYLFNDTKRKRLEQQLIQAQKMESLGTLAGGIAHDFNNILTIIRGYARQIENTSTQPEQIGAVAVIKDAVDRGAALVQQLLTSARQAEAQLSSVDLNELAQELEKMLLATFPKTLVVELRLHENLPRTRADRSQIFQVLLNLCVNANDAMPNGGTLTIQTELTPGAELAESFSGAAATPYVRVSIRDTGTGIPPEVKPHIFEPFYTTKERSKGTGLGLSVVYGVVNNHSGYVQVESEPGAGTMFSIYLPVEKQPYEGAAGEQPPKPLPQTILLVEDEEQLRDLAVLVLESDGFRVIPARDGMEAVELFSAHRDEIGLVVCDLGLPRLGGRDAFMRMKEMRPAVRAIVASGYLEPMMRSEILKAGVLDTIQKPYDFDELLEKIRSAIGKVEYDNHPQLF